MRISYYYYWVPWPHTLVGNTCTHVRYYVGHIYLTSSGDSPKFWIWTIHRHTTARFILAPSSCRMEYLFIFLHCLYVQIIFRYTISSELYMSYKIYILTHIKEVYMFLQKTTYYTTLKLVVSLNDFSLLTFVSIHNFTKFMLFQIDGENWEYLDYI